MDQIHFRSLKFLPKKKTKIGPNTDRIAGRFIRIHFGAELGVNLRAPVDRAGSRAVLDDGNDVEGDGTHVKQHAGDVDEGSEEENPLATEEYR